MPRRLGIGATASTFQCHLPVQASLSGGGGTRPANWSGRPSRIGTLSSATAEIMSEATSENGVSQRLRLRLADGETTEAFLLTPAGRGPFPAVLLFHDHGSEFRSARRRLIEPWDDSVRAALHRDWSARFYGGRSLGAELVRRGYCVMCVDAIGWGSRQGNGYASQQALAANLMQVGTSLAAVVAREDVQAAKYPCRTSAG